VTERDDFPVQPADEHNRRLVAQVHPPDWVNPAPRSRYHLVVIGGGTAGLVSAAAAAGLGATVALVERHLLGGDCLNVGCVPSKALLRSARAVHEARRAPGVGVRTTTEVEFGAVMARLRETRADIAAHDSAARLTSLGVDVYLGHAQFADRRTVEVEGGSGGASATLRFRRAVIATGSRPAVPEFLRARSASPGIGDAAQRATPILTSETIFSLTERPRHLLVVGGGPIGCELAQAFALLGSAVTLVESAPRLLPSEDPDASDLVERRLREDGVTVLTRHDASVVMRDRLWSSAAIDAGDPDAILVAIGRTPNIERLNLEATGVASDAAGVTVDDRLRTTNRRVYASGDVCSRFKFTHAADAMARIVIQNALFFGRKRASALVIPWCTYTDPEVAHVGQYADEARQRGHQVETVTIRFDEVDRAVVDEERDGFVRVHHERGRLLGCTVVASRAGDMIALPASALRRRATLDDLGATITPYPTASNAFRAAADAWRRTRLTPRVRGWLARYFRLM